MRKLSWRKMFLAIQPELEYPKYFGYHPKFGQKAKQFRYEVVRVERQGHISWWDWGGLESPLQVVREFAKQIKRKGKTDYI